MTPPKRTVQQQLDDEVARKARNPNGARQAIAEDQATPEFQQNRERLKAERLAREASSKAGAKT